MTFTTLVKTCSTKYFCNTLVAGLGKILSSENVRPYSANSSRYDHHLVWQTGSSSLLIRVKEGRGGDLACQTNNHWTSWNNRVEQGNHMFSKSDSNSHSIVHRKERVSSFVLWQLKV